MDYQEVSTFENIIANFNQCTNVISLLQVDHNPEADTRF
jgi:hypothetical protein